MSRGGSRKSGMGIALGGGLISAVLLWFSYPPVSVFPLALIAYAPLLNRAPDLEPRARFIVGWVHGICVQAALFYWLPEGLEQARGVDSSKALLVFTNFVVFQGLFSGLYLFLLGFLGWRKSPLQFALGAASLFALLETVFPFMIPLQLGGVIYRFPLWNQAFEVAGVALVSFLLVFSSALLARSVSPHGTGAVADLRGWAVYVLIVCFGLSAYGSWRLGAVSPEASTELPADHDKIAIGVVQPNLPVELDRQNDISSRAAILDLTLGVEEELPEGSRINIWPEGAFPFFFMPNERDGIPEGRSSYSHRYTKRILKHVRGSGRPLIMGALHDGGEAGTKNGVFAVAPDGSHQRYLKRWPLPWIEGGSLWGHMVGTTLEPLFIGAIPADDIFQVEGLRVLPTLYQELGYGIDLERRTTVTRPDLIVNLADDRWFGATSASELQVMNQVVRAVELRVPVVRVAYGGVSVLVGASGHITNRTGLLVQAAERWELPLSTITKPFSASHRVMLGVLALLCLLLAATKGFSTRRKSGSTKMKAK